MLDFSAAARENDKLTRLRDDVDRRPVCGAVLQCGVRRLRDTLECTR